MNKLLLLLSLLSFGWNQDVILTLNCPEEVTSGSDINWFTFYIDIQEPNIVAFMEFDISINPYENIDIDIYSGTSPNDTNNPFCENFLNCYLDESLSCQLDDFGGTFMLGSGVHSCSYAFLAAEINSEVTFSFTDANFMDFDTNILDVSYTDTCSFLIVNDNEYNLGDLNDDGELNILDIVILANMVLADEYDEIADMNGDGELNILDLVIMVNLILDGEPVCEDIDGNVYETIQIGDQLWMAENLKVTHYNDGSEIPTGYSDSEWAVLGTGAYAVYPTDEGYASQTTCGDDCADIYGNLYNGFVVYDVRGVCSDGWHVPADEEFMELEMYLGMSESEANDTGYRGYNEGSKLAGNSGLWNDGNLENNSSFGTSDFSAFPAGYRNSGNGNCLNMGEYGAFWSSSESNSNVAWRRLLKWDHREVSRTTQYKILGYSIRCIKDE